MIERLACSGLVEMAAFWSVQGGGKGDLIVFLCYIKFALDF
jgi:hypothetical protein